MERGKQKSQWRNDDPNGGQIWNMGKAATPQSLLFNFNSHFLVSEQEAKKRVPFSDNGMIRVHETRENAEAKRDIIVKGEGGWREEDEIPSDNAEEFHAHYSPKWRPKDSPFKSNGVCKVEEEEENECKYRDRKM